MPTRNGRNGMLFTSQGVINIKNKRWELDFSPLDPGIENYVSQHHSKAYLRHLIMNDEILGGQIASLQNLSFYLWLVKEARNQILNGTFGEWKKKMVIQVGQRL